MRKLDKFLSNVIMVSLVGFLGFVGISALVSTVNHYFMG